MPYEYWYMDLYDLRGQDSGFLHIQFCAWHIVSAQSVQVREVNFFFPFVFFFYLLSRVSRMLVQSTHETETHSNPTVKLYSFSRFIYSRNDL